MVAIHLICVGKLKEKHFAAACADSMSAFQALADKELGGASEKP